MHLYYCGEHVAVTQKNWLFRSGLIECAFGLLVNRWQLLKMPLSSKLSIRRINAMVCCLCKLHNYCIDQGSMASPERYIHDSLTLMDFMQIGENADAWPLGLLGGGEHFADIDGGQCKASRLGRRRIAFNDLTV